jgi:hypothetical protein
MLQIDDPGNYSLAQLTVKQGGLEFVNSFAPESFSLSVVNSIPCFEISPLQSLSALVLCRFELFE